MFATTFFLGSFLFIHISVVPVLSSCPESFTATNVSALGLTVSPVYTRSSDCDCKCVVGVDSNINTSLPADTCNTNTDNNTLWFLMVITSINALLLVVLIFIVVVYGVIMFRKKYGWVKYFGPNINQPSTNINDAYGVFDGNDEDTYSNEGYSQVEAAGAEAQHVKVTKTDKDACSNHGYTVVEAAGTEVQLQNAAKKDEDGYAPLGYSVVESAGTEGQRLSTAFLLPNSAAEDTEENEYSYTDLRFPNFQSDATPEKKGKGKKSDRAKEKGEKSAPGKEMSEQGKGKGEKSEPVKEKGETSWPGKKDKTDKKATAAENPIVKGGSVKPPKGRVVYTPVVVVNKGDTNNDDTTEAATPFGVILKDWKSTESSSFSETVSKSKKDLRLTQPKKHATVSKVKKDPRSTASALASAAASKVKKELKTAQSETSYVALSNRKDSKPTQPTASTQAAAAREDKKETKAKSTGDSGK